MIINIDDYLAHYGTPRRSGRYPWGSGENSDPNKRNKEFLDYVAGLRRQGMSDPDIARGFGMTTTELRAAKSIAKNAQRAADVAMIERLKEKHYTNVEIGRRMDMPESTVRALQAPGAKDKADNLSTMANMLKEQVAEKEYVDIGSGVETQLDVSKEKLATAVAILKEQGYEVHSVQVDQVFGASNKTTVKVLAPPGTTYRDIVMNKDKISQIQNFSDDGGRSILGIVPPLPVSSKRVAVRYGEEGGSAEDGVIYVRPGVDDVSLGSARYAQVRIAVDGTHYLKGMALYKDDLPPGADLLFNTAKSDTGNKLDAMKEISEDPDNPFGAIVRQKIDPATGKAISAMNIVGMKEGAGEEGSWDTWSKNLPSQFLSKQSPKLAQEQLDMTYERRKQSFDEINRLTNPAVKKKMLESFADDADSAAVHLQAAALPRQSTHVILPMNSLKDNEIYAPNYNNGERVALVRFPHGGTFEIPELTVNNNHPPAKKLLGRVNDAVGINSKVAERLSGADFDGDFVLVIPNNSGKVKTSPALDGLRNFDAKRRYPEYEGMKRMDAVAKGFEMGDISNLITDMTIKRAGPDELARAVRHSMVVIDAEKHKLNWKQSALDHNIAQLKVKYQGKSNAGASTLISRARSRKDVPDRKLRPYGKGGPIDPATGKKVWEESGESWVNAKGKTVFKTKRSTKLAETDDARTLSSGTLMEEIYADHSNRLKDLSNQARKATLGIKPTPQSKSASTAYAKEVGTLNAKLNLAMRNRPLERQAQVIANTTLSAKRAANPNMDASEVKKVKAAALIEARNRTGAQKSLIEITQPEWDAIQAGAISNHKLTQILDKADMDVVRKLATPKVDQLMSSAKTQRAQSMAASGYTQAEIAEALGVSLTTLKRGLSS